MLSFAIDKQSKMHKKKRVNNDMMSCKDKMDDILHMENSKERKRMKERMTKMYVISSYYGCI